MMSKPLDMKVVTSAVVHFETLDSRKDAEHARDLRSLLADYDYPRNLPREEPEAEMRDTCVKSGIDLGSNFCSRCEASL